MSPTGTPPIVKAFLARYAPQEYPALAEQMRVWMETQPLSGCRILDATPVFLNTVGKHWALRCAGAEVVIGRHPQIPADEKIVAALACDGFSVVAPDVAASRAFDVVLDCGGCFAGLPSRAGYVELTGSGRERYRNASQPVYLSDGGAIKKIETCLGTGEGFIRAFRKVTGLDVADKTFVVFGAGKVGVGIQWTLKEAGARVISVSDTRGEALAKPCKRQEPSVEGWVSRLDFRDCKGVENALAQAQVVVTATGVAGAAAPFSRVLIAHPRLILANMGLEDEFGGAIPEARVLNAKRPLNFVLDEPTHLKYIDATFALHNWGALMLLKQPELFHPGINLPSAADEAPILDATVRLGLIGRELERFGRMREA